jgi:transcriptional regulator GlxA family with amidase domain
MGKGKETRLSWFLLSPFSPFPFSRFTQRATSFMDEIVSIRIKHIQSLLLSTDHPLEEISCRCGFKHVESMSRIF